MISPRAILRSHRVAPLPRIHAPRQSSLPAWWRRLAPRHRAWLLLWAPWWLFNELPPPPPPRAREDAMAEQPEGSAGAWILDALDDLKLRFGLAWTAALLLRGAWLGGVVGIAWLALALVAGTSTPSLRQLMLLVAAGMILGLVLRVFHRPRYLAVALLLERAFELRSRLSTAVAGLRLGEPARGSLHALQLADAANMLDRARAQLRPVHWVPVREIFVVFIVALTMLLLLVAQRPEGDIPPPTRVGVPAFVPVSERLAAEQQPLPPELPDPATLQEVEDLSRTSNQARQDLETIAGALESNPVTAPASEAIDSESYAEANERLDDAAGDVMQLPSEQREALADQLDRAAADVSEDNPELADASRAAADDVRSGDDTGALDDLGDEIEQTGESVISSQATGGELSETQAEQQAGSSEGGSESGSAPGEPQAGEPGAGESQPGSAGDPGAGVDASGGTGSSQEGDAPTGAGDGTEGGDQQGGSGGDAAQGDPSEGEGAGQAGSGEPGDASGDPGGSTSGGENDAGESSQGSGAGGGQSDTDEPTDEGGTGGAGGEQESDEQAPEAGQGEAGDPPPGGDNQDGEGGSATAGGGSSIQLPGTSGERVRSGSDIGASSVGTGGGVGAGSGDSGGTASGSTGPDSNTVPVRWRTVVEDYFREGGSP